MTKITFLGLMPGALLGLLVLAVREARSSGARAYRAAAPGLALAVSPLGLYALLGLRSGGLSVGLIGGAVGRGVHHRSLTGLLGYTWQLYLPRLPGMHPTLHGVLGASLWFEQLVGKYGWLDTSFPPWVVKAALFPAALIAVLAIKEIVSCRSALARRRAELAIYAIMALGVLTGVAAAQYKEGLPGSYMQLRYLLPLLAFAGVALALAARGAGRRWGPVVGALLVMLVLAHDLFSQLLVVSRYYG